MASKKDETPAGKLPMFYQKPTLLSAERHAKAGLAKNPTLAFAKSTNSIPIQLAEFVEAAKHYPIVFTTDEVPTPAVVVGLEATNSFVDDAGKWQAGRYVPAYVRKYPFVLMENAEAKQLVLCIDEGASMFEAKAKKGSATLYEDGKPSELAENAMKFCVSDYEQHKFTREFGALLKSLDLLSPNQTSVTLESGRVITLQGFQLIDEKKLNALPDSKIAELHKKGWLGLIYFALQATSNWRVLGDMAAVAAAA